MHDEPELETAHPGRVIVLAKCRVACSKKRMAGHACPHSLVVGRHSKEALPTACKKVCWFQTVA
jgi:hypothetical protein